MAQTMTDLIPRFLEHRRVRQHRAANTIKTDKTGLHLALIAFGDVQPGNVTQRHVDAYLSLIGQHGPVTFNQRLSTLRTFFQWCRDQRLVPPAFDPLAGIEARPVIKEERSRVPVTQFQALLDAAPTPHGRIIIAIGLYLFLRVGEMATLRIEDVNLDDGELRVVVHKKRGGDKIDFMPISAELDRELRDYLRWYAAEAAALGLGALQPDWYLIPSRTSGMGQDEHGRFIPGARVPTTYLRPDRPYAVFHRVVQTALEGIGVECKGKREGGHTLRRSGARALFDQLVEQGYDGALRLVQAMLHHEGIEMTERYIGLREDRFRRDQNIKGQVMFNMGDNVVQLRKVEDGG